MITALIILILSALLIYGVLLLHQTWTEREAERQEAIIRAALGEISLVIIEGEVRPDSPQSVRALPNIPCVSAHMPAVFRSARRAGPWAHGGNAHQRRVFLRAAA